jgi:DNA-binding XRE family transcriptional regulator
MQEAHVILDPEEIAERIAIEQYPIHTKYHERLKEFSVAAADFSSILAALPTIADTWLSQPQPPPKPPRRYAFCRLLGHYACDLLSAELAVTAWADEIGAIQRAEDLTVQYVHSFGGISQSVTHHASETQMRQTIKQVIQDWLPLQPRPIKFLPLPSPAPPDIGGQIRSLRTEARLTIAELAEKIDITPRNLHRHESGATKRIRPAHLRKYESVFSELLKRRIVLAQTSY